MKARNSNNVIVLYNEVPKSFTEGEINIIGGFDLLSDIELQAYGFYDVVTPAFDYYTQKLSDIYFDDVNKVFTYNVLTLDVPIPIPPIPEREYTFLEFMYGERLTEVEVIALYAKEREITDDGLMVHISLDGLRLANGILISHPNTKKAVDIWVATGVITQKRANEILAV